jgi:hypothetical protein
MELLNEPNIFSIFPGPTPRFGSFLETFKIFNDPISYVGKNFEKYGRIFGTSTSSLTTPPSSS